MKTIIMILIAASLSACVTPGAARQAASKLKYDAKPSNNTVLKQMASMIRPTLKDPDSLKNLMVTSSYKCYASKTGMTDNVSPKYSHGYWCYNFAYQAANSYGGFVRGSTFGIYVNNRMRSINSLGETVRKHDDVYTYEQPAF